MSYCPGCGLEQPIVAVAVAEAEAAGDQAEAVEEVSSDAVEIARIEADRDVTLARIGAGVEKAAVEAVADGELAAAQARADVLEDIVTPPEPEPGDAPETVVVVGDEAAGAGDADGGVEGELEPPDISDAPAPAAVPSGRRSVWW